MDTTSAERFLDCINKDFESFYDVVWGRREQIFVRQIHYKLQLIQIISVISLVSNYPNSKDFEGIRNLSRNGFRKYLKNLREHIYENSDMIREISKFYEL